MGSSKDRPPRLFVLVWFIAAAGVLAGGWVLGALGWSGAMGLGAGTEMRIAFVMAAFMAGLGIGEWRGLRHAQRARAA